MQPYIKFPRAAVEKPWRVADLCAAYNWPTNLAGTGKIGIIELGGTFNPVDIAAFAEANGIPVPSVKPLSPFRPDPNGADGEVALDIQVAAAAFSIATGKPAEIVMYWVIDIAEGVRRATADGCSVVSISWGADEARWGAAALDDMEAAAAAAVAAGTVVFAASGDNDSSDGGPGAANVDAPASCPHVIGCGGTMKPESGAERVWNNEPGHANGQGTGGGYSTHFPPQPWQVGVPAHMEAHGNAIMEFWRRHRHPKPPPPPTGNGRMVPDVAANADPNTGYEIVLNGQGVAVGGTSAVAPLYAGLVAAAGTQFGFITPLLYTDLAAFNDITQGDNGAFSATAGPDPCTGLGSPNGAAVAQLLMTGKP